MKIIKFKCNKKTGLCSALADRCEGVTHKGKGFTQVMALTKDELSLTLLGVKYRTSAKDKDIMLNYCPFCGEQIDWFRK